MPLQHIFLCHRVSLTRKVNVSAVGCSCNLFGSASKVVVVSVDLLLKKIKIVPNTNLITYYIADLPVTRLRLLTNKSDNIDVPSASLRSLILLLGSSSLAFCFFNYVDITQTRD